MAELIITERSDIVAIANAVRNKAEITNELTLGGIITSINNIETGTDTSDATATANEIFAGETAYTADGKVTGTFTIEDELSEQNDLISQISTLVATKAGGSGGASIETCTVTVSGAYFRANSIAYTAYENGAIVAKSTANNGTLTNVVCGSAMVFGGMYLGDTSNIGSLEVGAVATLYQVPTTPNATATVTLEQD